MTISLSDPFVIVMLAAAATLVLLALGLFRLSADARRQAGAIDAVSGTQAELAKLQGEAARGQAELAARLGQLSETMAASQERLGERFQAQERALTKQMTDSLADLSRRFGESLHKQTTDQEKTMGDLKERLGAIGVAQDKIQRLSEQVVSLQDVLTNKQARGAFGEVQLEDLVRSALPPNAYKFQASLSNSKRADCLLDIPNPPGPIVVDAKFPLEGYHAIRAAEGEEARSQARKIFARDVNKHITDIAGRYILPGETADSAMMFVPSEAVYAELHAELPAVISQSHQARVYIVSPTTLMAVLNTVRAVLKDAQMQEQAHVLQKEIVLLGEDVGRLDDRVAKLQRHFGQAENDIRDIRISTEKVTKRASKIDDLEFGEIEGKGEAASLLPE